MTTATATGRNDTSIAERSRESQYSGYKHDLINSGDPTNSLLYWLKAKVYDASIEALQSEFAARQDNPAGPIITFQDERVFCHPVSHNPGEPTEVYRYFSDRLANSVWNSVEKLGNGLVLEMHGRTTPLKPTVRDIIEIVPTMEGSNTGTAVIQTTDQIGQLPTSLENLTPHPESSYGTLWLHANLRTKPRYFEGFWNDDAEISMASWQMKPEIWRRVRTFRNSLLSVAEVNKPEETITQEQNTLEGIIQAFAQGVEGESPLPETVETARLLVHTAGRKAQAKAIEVDDADGILSFELRLQSGLLVVGELSIEGDLEANIYDDQNPDAEASIKEIWLKHLPNATIEDLISWF